MLIYVKIIKNNIFFLIFNLCLFYDNFMLINVKIKKKMFFIGRTDGQTHGQLKTIVRNLTKSIQPKNAFYAQNFSPVTVE